MLEGRRILVVEDDYLVALTVVELLEDVGAEVVGPVSTADEAVALVTAGDIAIDAAILDVNLDGETSFPVADALAERNVFFVFATGYGGAVLGDHYRHYPRCQKPFEPEHLFQTLAAGAAAAETSATASARPPAPAIAPAMARAPAEAPAPSMPPAMAPASVPAMAPAMAMTAAAPPVMAASMATEPLAPAADGASQPGDDLTTAPQSGGLSPDIT